MSLKHRIWNFIAKMQMKVMLNDFILWSIGSKIFLKIILGNVLHQIIKQL